MVFNSLTFLVFIAVFFPLYFGTRGRTRIWVSLLASYLFYGWWDWRFLSLIIFSTVMDWFFGLLIAYKDDPAGTRAQWQNLPLNTKTQKHLNTPASAFVFGHITEWLVPRLNWNRRAWLVCSMILNLGFLGFFKYFNFFADSFAQMLGMFGVVPSWTTLNIILPVGISFYTFQSMSYTIDVYRKEIKWEPSLLRFATFIALFPQLVAGPIVRAIDLLPQMYEDKPFDRHRWNSGMGRVLWGFFKKVAVADSLAPFVDQVFQSPETFGSLHLLIGVVFYAFQIYCDFSGYSDMAIGFARMMGYDFPENFRTPYFSKSFSEFWQRWHISLSSWLRDYLYIPLGGNRRGKWHTYKNNMLTMLLGGLWHGANWAFVFWGFLHGLYLIVQRLTTPLWHKFVQLTRMPRLLDDALAMLTVFALTLLAWVYFRSGSIGLAGGDSFATANKVLSGIFSGEGFSFAAVINKFQVIKGVLLIGILLLVEVTNGRWRWNVRQVNSPVWRLGLFAAALWLIAFFGTFGANAFIYFQF